MLRTQQPAAALRLTRAYRAPSAVERLAGPGCCVYSGGCLPKNADLLYFATRYVHSFSNLHRASHTASCRGSRCWLHAAAQATAAASPGTGVASVASLLPQDAARAEQQALLSLLHEIEKSNSNAVKVSLRVFHLQQLAAIRGASYLRLQQHPAVVQLIEELTAAAAAKPGELAESTGELSPPQLHALKGSMSVAEACSSLRCFAAASADVDRMHLAALMQHVLRDAGQVNEYDAACVLYSIRKYHFNPRAELEQQLEVVEARAAEDGVASSPVVRLAAESLHQKQKSKARRVDSSKSDTRTNSRSLSKLSLKMARVCAWALERRATTATPKSLVCCLYEYGLLQLLPWRLLLLLLKRLRQKQQLQQLDGQGLALLALSLSLLKQRETKIMRRIGWVVQQREQEQQQPQQQRAPLQEDVLALLKRREGVRKEYSPQSLCLLLHATAKLSLRETGIICAVCARIERAGSTMTNQQLVICAEALGLLGVRHEAAWQTINSLLAERHRSLSPCEISLGTLGASKAAAADPETLTALLSQALSLQRGFTGQQLVNLLDGIALSGQAKQCSEALSAAPQSVQLFIEAHQQPFQAVEPQQEDLAGNTDRSSCDSSKRSDICLDLLSEGCYCPLSGNLLGAALLKARHLQKMGFLYCSIRRQQWLDADAAKQQRLVLHALQQAVNARKDASA
ncbi:hypothetical protein, conserved [Eimeria necatrix]|uniref:RAP domain-containing protein n=1 Tax=Eimeria necatrix TaxID=51315 RepID=U6MNU9_9EIME|nr:hypothetical protein, conserved [Eimeria necatrix]CDJ65686.1 hypothetical protein, conserved [Eimeria necatrix]